jgi:rubrerythrin
MSSKLSPDELSKLNGLYLDRLQTAFLYNFASTMVRAFSEDLASRFSAFGRQDANQALCLHGFLCDPRALAHYVTAEVSPHLVKGVIATQAQGADEKKAAREHEPKETVLNFLQTFFDIESQILAKLQDLDPAGALMEASGDYLSLSWLRAAVEERAATLERMAAVVRAGLWARKRQGPWKCLNCGLVVPEDVEADEVCPCCKVEQRYLARGDFDFSA